MSLKILKSDYFVYFIITAFGWVEINSVVWKMTSDFDGVDHFIAIPISESSSWIHLYEYSGGSNDCQSKWEWSLHVIPLHRCVTFDTVI